MAAPTTDTNAPEPLSKAAPAAPAPAPVAPEDEFDPFVQDELDALEQPAAPAPEPKPEPTAAPKVEPVAPTVHKHSKRLLNESRDWLNITQVEIDSTPSEELDARVYEAQRQYRIATQKQNDAILNRAGQAQVATQKQDDPEPDIDLGDDVKGWDAETVKVLKKVAAAPLKEVAALKKQLADLEKRDQDRETRGVMQRLQSKAKQHADVFTKDAAGKAKEVALMGYLQSLQRTSADTLEDDFDEAVKLLGFAPQTSPATAPKPAVPTPPAPPEPDDKEAELAKRQAEWAKAGAAKSTHRGAEEPPGPRRFYQKLKERERALEQTDEEFEIAHGLNGKK